MKHLKIYEKYQDDYLDYRWLKNWINDVFDGQDLSSGSQFIRKDEKFIEFQIYYRPNKKWDAWKDGLLVDNLQDIINFGKYLLDKKIIENQDQFRLYHRALFEICFKVPREVIDNHPELTVYRDTKKYNI